MPPKKAPSSLASTKTLVPTGTAAAALSSSRSPLPPATLPVSSSLSPLWTPSSRPRELFPEWPSAAVLAAESWCTPEAPYEDPLSPDELPLPHGHEKHIGITWKRPSQFLPPIPEPTHAQNINPPAPVVVPEPKTPAKKGGAAAAPAATKKAGAAEPEPVKKAPPKHAHVFFSDPHDPDHATEHKKTASAATPATSAARPGHATAGHAAPGAASQQSHPHSTPVATAAAHHNDTNHHHRIPRDFRRLWSPDELEEIAEWRLEESRIQLEKEARERVYMAFEDAIAYIVNERPRGFAQEEDVDADDLADDGQDDDDDEAEGNGAGDAISNDSSPWGILPPSRIEIAPNAVCRPESPHGDVVHGDMASLLRIVEQLFHPWTQGQNNIVPAPVGDQHQQPPPPPAFLWRAIYPQDATGTPIYNPGGKYSVKLFVFGKWRRVDIDDKLPVDAEGNIVILTSAMKSEIWPALLTKALLKVVHWLHGSILSREEGPSDTEPSDGAIRMANTVLSALTGWKVSRWQPDQRIGSNASDSTLQQLLEFVPSSHATDDSSESSGDNGEQLLEPDGDTGGLPLSPSAATTLSAGSMKPRTIICCRSIRGNSALHAGEAALVTDIVGDTENTMVKFTSLRGPSSVPEELIAVDRLEFLLIHPPFKHSDLHVQYWTVAKSEAASNTDDPSHALLWTPFPNPTTQFALLKLPKSHKHEKQSAGDGSPENGDHGSITEHHRSPPMEMVFTLTRIPPADPSASTQDARLRSAQELAKHVPDMDPHGSLVLIQELQGSNNSSPKSSPPMVITLNTITSTRVLLPSLPGCGGDHVFRVLPQQSLCYGYALQIESQEKVDFQEPSTYWRNVCDVQVVNSDGVYAVMLPNSWNVLFKHNIELTPPPASAAHEDQQQHIELFVDLHLSDAMLGPYVHTVVVDDATSKVARLSSLCSKISFPVSSNNEVPATSYAFTIIVDCAPQRFHVQEGKWHLTLGSNWLFKASSSHQMKLTTFEGEYEANKPLLCFRDVLTAPKRSIWTSFELTLFSAKDGSSDDTVADNLAVKLEVIDSVNDLQLSESVAPKSVRLLQLPRRTSQNGGAEDPTDDGEYVLQGTIDRSKCVVPSALCSVRPFRNRVGAPKAKESAVKENENTGDDAEAESAEIQSSFPSARAKSCVKWRLNCWSAEDVKLDVDRTKELKFEAIRASWAEAARDRNAQTNGAVSRLMFLGKTDAAEVKIRHDGVPDELTKKLKARSEWIETAASKMTDGVYLEQRVGPSAAIGLTGERMKTPEDFQEEDRLLNEEITAAERQLVQKREDRLAAREQRAQEVKDLVQSLKAQRSAAVKKRLQLWQQRDAILASGGDNSSLPTTGA